MGSLLLQYVGSDLMALFDSLCSVNLGMSRTSRADPSHRQQRKLWLEGSNEQLDPHFCQEAILISTNIYSEVSIPSLCLTHRGLATLFHAGLLISVICGSRMVGTFDESLSGFIKGDCCYFVLVLLASTTNLVSPALTRLPD